jgi:hypothetical protein
MSKHSQVRLPSLLEYHSSFGKSVTTAPQRVSRLSIPSGYCHVYSNRLNSAVCDDDHTTGLRCTPHTRNVTRNLNCTSHDRGGFVTPATVCWPIDFLSQFFILTCCPAKQSTMHSPHDFWGPTFDSLVVSTTRSTPLIWHGASLAMPSQVEYAFHGTAQRKGRLTQAVVGIATILNFVDFSINRVESVYDAIGKCA